MDGEAQMMVLVALIIVVPFLMRRIAWWYWGIDRAVTALESIAASLDRFEAERADNRRGIRRVA